MPKYVLAYHGGSMPDSPEAGEKVMAAWNSWLGGLGKAMIDMGSPTGGARTIAAGGKVSDGGGANPLTGYSIIEAADIDAAVKLSMGCPQLVSGGSVEVTEIMPVM